MSSVVNLDQLFNDELKKRVLSLLSIYDWSDECGQCGRPSLLHKGGPCTRSEKENSDVILKIWKEFQSWIKTVISMVKAEIDKGKEESLLLEGLTRLVREQSENMTKLVGQGEKAQKNGRL